MAKAGGPENIGAVNIGVEADIKPLLTGLDQAKAQAAQKGEEIGQAAKAGVQRGAAGGGGGGGGSIPSVPKIDGNALWAQIQADAAGMAPVGASAAAGAAAGAGAAVSFAAIAAGIEAVAQVLPNVVDGLFSVTKQQMELKDALERNAISLQAAAATMEKMFSSATGGNPNISQDIPGKIARLDEKMAEIDSQLAEYTLKDVYDYTIGYPMHWLMDTPTRRAQLTEQREEFDSERGVLSRQVSGIRTREKLSGTIGGVARSVAMEMGMEVPANFGPLGTASPAEAAMIADLLRNNNMILQEILRASTQSYQQGQQRAVDMMRGIDRADR